MKIVFINTQYQLGGGETVTQQLIRACNREGHQVTLRVAIGKSYPLDVDPLYPRLLSRLSTTRFHDLVEGLFPRYQWTDREFRKIAHTNADLIHIHNFHGIYATAESLAYLAHRKKVIWTFHRFWGVTGGCDHPLGCLRYKSNCGECPQVGTWSIGNVDNTAQQLSHKIRHLSRAPLHIIAPSKHLMEIVRSSLVGNLWQIYHIPNGVDHELFNIDYEEANNIKKVLSVPEGSQVILVVNRDYKDPVKGFALIQEALEYCALSTIDVLLVGNNSKWAAEKLPKWLRIHSLGYVGSREQMAKIYRAADIFLYASLGENFPCAILEAMAAECCVVSTPTDGVLEQIDDQQTGLIAKAIEGHSLGETLMMALSDSEMCQEIGRKARNRIYEAFTEKLMIQRHMELYKYVSSL